MKANKTSVSKEDELLLYEVDDKVTDVQSVINKILSLSSSSGGSGKKKIELLIDGGVFAMMLTSDKATLKELNVALQNAAAVIIYRASPKQKQQVV